jgi:hypothetical protein
VQMLAKVLLCGRPTFKNIPRSARRAWAAVLSSAIQDVNRSGSLEAWVKFLILPSCVLGTHGLAQGSEPREAAQKSHRLILRRAQE